MALSKKKYSEKIGDILFEEKSPKEMRKNTPFWHMVEDSMAVGRREPAEVAPYIEGWCAKNAKVITASKGAELVGFYVLQKSGSFWYIELITHTNTIFSDLLKQAINYWKTELKEEGGRLFAFAPFKSRHQQSYEKIYTEFLMNNFKPTRPLSKSIAAILNFIKWSCFERFQISSFSI